MLYRKVALLVMTLLVLVGSAWEVEAGESYNLRVIYYSSPTFQFADKIGEVFNDFTDYMTTLIPPIKVKYVKDHRGGSAADAVIRGNDIYISGFQPTHKPTDMFVYFIGNDEKVPKPGHGMVCSTNFTDHIIFVRAGKLSQWGQFGPEEQALMTKNLTEQMAKKLLLNPTCGAELLDGYVRFHTCASKAFQQYINSFDEGNFCLAKPYYGLQLKFFADNEIHFIDDKILFPYEVVEPWYYKIREAFAMLNPGINVYKTMVNYDLGSFNTSADLRNALVYTEEVNLTIIVQNKLAPHVPDIGSLLNVSWMSSVCDKDPLEKAIVVNAGSTKQDVEQAYWEIVTGIAERFFIKVYRKNDCKRYGDCPACKGLMEGNGKDFSSCSSQELQHFINWEEPKNGGVFCLPKIG